MHAKMYTLKQFKQKALDQFIVYDSKPNTLINDV